MRFLSYLRWLLSPNVFPEEKWEKLKPKELEMGVLTEADWQQQRQEGTLLVEKLLKGI